VCVDFECDERRRHEVSWAKDSQQLGVGKWKVTFGFAMRENPWDSQWTPAKGKADQVDLGEMNRGRVLFRYLKLDDEYELYTTSLSFSFSWITLVLIFLIISCLF
jgi:hypothetical protein